MVVISQSPPRSELDGLAIQFVDTSDRSGQLVVASWPKACPKCGVFSTVGFGLDTTTGEVVEIEVETECGCKLTEREAKLMLLHLPDPVKAVLVDVGVWSRTPWGQHLDKRGRGGRS